jgi:hypothetical protein
MAQLSYTTFCPHKVSKADIWMIRNVQKLFYDISNRSEGLPEKARIIKGKKEFGKTSVTARSSCQAPKDLLLHPALPNPCQQEQTQPLSVPRDIEMLAYVNA